MFGPGPSEEINVEAKMAREKPVDEQASQARYDEKLDHDRSDTANVQRPSLVTRFKRWLAARF